MQRSCINFGVEVIVRKTKSLEALVAVFKKSENAFSVVDLVNRFEGEMNKTTVYRILEKLEKDGVVHSFLGMDGLKWYAKCKGCSSKNHIDTHPHFQCQSCGKLDCLSTNISIPPMPGRKVELAQVLLIGTCERCQLLN